MPAPLDLRKKPAAVKIHVSTGAGVDITWSDGHSSHFDFAFLRDECPCATCNDERARKESSAPSGTASAAVFPMFKPKVTAKTAHSVGNYAISIAFNDGHSTGIYSYDQLRQICPCSDCARDFRSI